MPKDTIEFLVDLKIRLTKDGKISIWDGSKSEFVQLQKVDIQAATEEYEFFGHIPLICFLGPGECKIVFDNFCIIVDCATGKYKRPCGQVINNFHLTASKGRGG